MKRIMFIMFIYLVLVSCATNAKSIDVESIKKDYIKLVDKCFEIGGFIDVSILHLMINPEVYNNKCISTSGYLDLSFEGERLYLDKSSLDEFNYTHSIEVDAYSRERKLYELYNTEYAVGVVGLFKVRNLDKEKAFYKGYLSEFVVNPEIIDFHE